MYSPRIEPDKVERLFELKQMIIASGEKTNMIELVDEALEQYLSMKEPEMKRKLEQRNGRECNGG